MKETIEHWKKSKIAYAEFQFSCGGDSMNDTEIVFFDAEGNEVADEHSLAGYFEDEVYKEVNFYEASDGHYIGESGVVRIELNDEGDDFYYIKSAQSEWSERYSGEMLCEVTKEEVEFLNEYIGGMSDANWNGRQTDYKKDFILKPEHEKMVEELHEKFQDCANDFVPETKGEMSGDSTQYNTAEDEGEMGVEFVEQEGKTFVKLYVICEVYEYTDAED
jgi:hypothetical protein